MEEERGCIEKMVFGIEREREHAEACILRWTVVVKHKKGPRISWWVCYGI